MKQVTVIGDIHGCFDTFVALLKKIPKEDIIVLAGDLIDRGPKSMQVVQYVMEHPEILCVKGNHEEMMYTDLDKTTEYPGTWEHNGGEQTLRNYEDNSGKLDRDKIDKHIEWMKKLPLYLEFEDVKNDDGRHLVVSHASIIAMWNHKEESNFKDEVLWNRDSVNTSQCLRNSIYNVFGHTPQYMTPTITEYYANIDTGCVFNRTGYHNLTALRFPSLEIIQQTNIDSKMREL